MTTNIFLFMYQLVLFLIDFTVFFVKAILLLFRALFTVFVPPAQKSVEGEIVLITGGGHGLGRALALMLAQRNAKIVLWDINEDNCRKTADEIKKLGFKAYAYQCDVSSRDDVRKAAQQVRKQIGHPTILINNAGILHCQPFLNLNDQQLDRIVGINLTSHFWTVREFLPAMQQAKHGHIVCISSMAGICGYENLVDYGATKFGVAGFMKHLRVELRAQGHDNIHCTTIHPTIINTGMAKKPRFRHPLTSPVIETDYAAEVIVDAILRNRIVVFIPPGLQFVFRIINSLPVSIQDCFGDFVAVGLDAHN